MCSPNASQALHSVTEGAVESPALEAFKSRGTNPIRAGLGLLGPASAPGAGLEDVSGSLPAPHFHQTKAARLNPDIGKEEM